MHRVSLENICKVLLLLSATLTYGSTAITYDQLLREMVNLQSIAEYPDPPYIAGRASSCDTTVPADSVPMGFSNNDKGFYLDIHPEGYLMLDVKGPGMITHIWSANPNDSLFFYFDNQETPSWTVSMPGLLDGTGVIKEPFSHVAAQGHNCNFPITYQTRCRVYYKGGWPYIYYHIDYRTYAPGTVLPTFDTSMITKYKSLIDSIQTVLSDSVSMSSHETLDQVFAGTVQANQTVTTFKLDGTAAITEIVFMAEEKVSPAFLRSCLLEITFDTTVYPQVRIPVGEFFCSVPAQKPYRTLPLSVSGPGTMVSRWCMPYREHAVIRLVNKGQDSASFVMKIKTQPYHFTNNTMYFFARWRQDRDVAIKKNLYGIFYMADPLRDHPIIHIKGKGVHAGTILHIWNREDEWWGEGDDKITIDDRSESVIKGTGTEDYFGYAWSSTSTFSHAYHTQPYTDGFTGRTVNARFHISDPQPFLKSYKFDMEIQTVNKPTMMDFGRAVLFYACGEAFTDHDTVTGEDVYLRAGLPLIVNRNKKANGVPGRIPMMYDTKRHQVIAMYPDEDVTLKILTPNGRKILQSHSVGSAAICTASLPSGIYIAVMSTRNLRNQVRFIVSR